MKKTQKSKRAVWVFTGLLTILTGTSALLLAVAPAPLKPDGSAAAMASTDPSLLPVEGLRATNIPVKDGRWEYIYVRHSKTAIGDINTLPGDHFIIHSGLSGSDGQINMSVRWSNQASATPPKGATEIHPKCVSVVIVGDLDRNVPTPAQVMATTRLVRTLQQELKISADHVLMMDPKISGASPAGVGRYFPVEAFKDNLLR